jgi:glycosyltransferase involved in cell wall biosynthesis
MPKTVLPLAALVVAHNEEGRLADCLARLTFADEIVVVLDKCTDGSEAVARRFTDRILLGSWEVEGERRNAGLAACHSAWVLEVDADEWVPAELAAEIRATIAASPAAWHRVPIDNYIGQQRVRNGWGASFGVRSAPRLSRRGVKLWGLQRVHPKLVFTGTEGPPLRSAIAHYVDRDLADMFRRLNSYSSARARDLIDRRETGGTLARNILRFYTRFFKCYVRRKGYREGIYGFAIALCAGLYPLLSHLKAREGQGRR